MHSTQLALDLTPPSADSRTAALNTVVLSVGVLWPMAGRMQTLFSRNVWLHVRAKGREQRGYLVHQLLSKVQLPCMSLGIH